MTSRYALRIGCLSVAVGLFYITWPLGYWLNPAVARDSLASGLEATNQPYNWLFITTDVISSTLAIILCYLLWRRYKATLTKSLSVSLLFVVAFGIGTIVDALLPEHCVPNLMRCQSFSNDHYLLIHGIFSILASVFLFIALVIFWVHQRRNHLLTVLLVGYCLFGMIGLIEAIIPGDNGNWSEDYYITLCGIWLMLIPYAVRKLENQNKQKILSE